jgi:hypothetical protein
MQKETCVKNQVGLLQSVKCFVVSLAVWVPVFASAPVVLVGCGGANAFERLEKKDEKDKGKNALQNGDYDTAIEELKKHLADNPNDTQAKAMLATAQMRKVGINEIQLASKLSSGSGDWKSIVSAMPQGNEQNVEGLKEAVSALSSIPANERSAEQSFQLALAQASLAVTLTKKAAGSDSNLSDAKVDAMSDAQVLEVYDSLQDTQTTVSSQSALKDNAGAQKIAGLADKIDKEQGATDAQKVRNFLKSNN